MKITSLNTLLFIKKVRPENPIVGEKFKGYTLMSK